MLNRLDAWRSARRHAARARRYRGPACGHGACSQHWIDTGDNGCLVATYADLPAVAAIVVSALVVLTLLAIECVRPEWIMRLARWHG